MWKRTIAGLLMAGLAGSAGAAEPASERAEIRSELQDGKVVLAATVTLGNSELTGRYQFVIEKAGAAGRSNVRQGGRFDAGAGNGSAILLTRSQISVGADDRLTAELSITLSDGRTLSDRYVLDRSD